VVFEAFIDADEETTESVVAWVEDAKLGVAAASETAEIKTKAGIIRIP